MSIARERVLDAKRAQPSLVGPSRTSELLLGLLHAPGLGLDFDLTLEAEEEQSSLAPSNHRVASEDVLPARLRARRFEDTERAVLQTPLPLRKERLAILSHLERRVDARAQRQGRRVDEMVLPRSHAVAEVLDLVVHVDHGVVARPPRPLADREGQHRGLGGRQERRGNRDAVLMAEVGELRRVAERVGEGQ